MPQTYDITKIKQHPYLAVFDGTVLGPLADAPRIESDIEVFDSLIYENGGHEEVSRTITRASAKITIRTKNIDAALTLTGNFARGDDVAGSSARKVLSFTPITEDAGEKTLSFGAAVLLPDIEYVPTMGGDHVARLTFMAYPDGSGKLFTFS